VLRYTGPFGPVLIAVLVVAAVENARDLPLFWRRRHANDCAAAAVRSAGHADTIAFVGGLVSESTNDLIELGRRWLRHVDQCGIALVAVARTDRIARAYICQGFQRVAADDPLLLMRLPRDR
jgi:hypothetical protein